MSTASAAAITVLTPHVAGIFRRVVGRARFIHLVLDLAAGTTGLVELK